MFQRVECELGLVVKRRLARVAMAAECCDLSLFGVGVRLPDRFIPVGERVEVGPEGLPLLRGVVSWSERGRLGISLEGSLVELADSWVGELLLVHDLTLADLLVA